MAAVPPADTREHERLEDLLCTHSAHVGARDDQSSTNHVPNPQAPQ